MKRLIRIKVFGVKAYTREFNDPDRWRAFFHNRLWIWLPVAPIVLFFAGYLQRYLGEGMPLGMALTKGAVDAALGAFCYVIGVWASTAPDEPVSEEDKKVSKYDWLGRLAFIGLLLLAIAMICISEIGNLWVGEGSVGRNLGKIFVKLVCVAAIFAPVWITYKRK